MTLSQKDAVNEYFVHTEVDITGIFIADRAPLPIVEAHDAISATVDNGDRDRVSTVALIDQYVEQLAEKEARFHTAYAHVLAAIDCLECFENSDYAPIISVLKQYRSTMPLELIDTTLTEEFAIKKRMLCL